PNGWIKWINRGARMSFFVGNECAIGNGRTVDAVFPTRLPKDFIAAEESQIYASIARGFNICPLASRPVLVVTDGHENPVIEDQRATSIGIDSREITDIVTVGLQPPNHRVLGVEKP